MFESLSNVLKLIIHTEHVQCQQAEDCTFAMAEADYLCLSMLFPNKPARSQGAAGVSGTDSTCSGGEGIGIVSPV